MNIIDINKAGELYTSKSREDVLGTLAGNALNCVIALNKHRCCGTTDKCKECTIKNCIEETLLTGKDIYKKEGVIYDSTGDKPTTTNILVSSSLIEHRGKKSILLTIDDITKQKDIEKQLKESNSLKDKIFSIMVHDLKNPFNSILGYSELLMELDDSENAKEDQKIFTKYLYTVSKQAYSLLEDLLTWARLQMNNIPYNPGIFSLNKVLDKNIEHALTTVNNKRIKLINEVEKQITVSGDEFMVNTIIRNLLSNAVKFTKPEGMIKMNAELIAGDKVKISIHDNGVGVSNEVQNRLFKMGENISSKGTAGEKGTGLGLILCKEFVEKNGGCIGLESKEDESGSTFWFTLPTASPSDDADNINRKV